MDLFDNIPIAAIVNGLYLCMHGGISDELKTIATINQLDRFREVDEEGLLADLLWADPAPSKKIKQDYVYNSDRQISVVFGKKPVKDLLKKENLRAILRGHQMKQKGYKFHQWDGEDEFPPVITVFSAPNYSGSGNDAAVVISDGDSVDLRTFSEKRGKPFVLHDRADAFSVFQPKLQSLVLDMLYNVFKMAQSAKSSSAGRALGTSTQNDINYLKTIIQESDHAKKDELLKKIDKEVENQKKQEEGKQANPAANLADLLGGLEDEFDFTGIDDLSLDDDKNLSGQIDMMKQLSESFANDAKNAELSLKTGDSIDRHMDMDAVTETMSHLESKKSIELSKASSKDEREKVVELNDKDRYKAMKDLDRQNERASPKQIARRASK